MVKAFNLDLKTRLGKYLSVLRPEDRRKLTLVVIVQSLLGFLDLLGVAIIGILGALAVSGLSTGTSGDRISRIIEIAHLQNFTLQNQIALLGFLAALLLVLRTILSVLVTRRVLFYLGQQAARISTDLISKLFSQSISDVNSRTMSKTIFSVTDGVNAIVLGIISAAVNFLADASLLFILGCGLLLVDPFVALSTLVFFISIGLFLYRILQFRARNLGLQIAQSNIALNSILIEGLTTYREAFVKNRRGFYVNKLQNIREDLGRTTAEMAFMPSISKYAIESAMVIGTLLISASQFLLTNASQAIATLSIFLAAGTRIAPAILRMQQNATSIKSNAGIAQTTIQMIEELKNRTKSSGLIPTFSLDHSNFQSNLVIRDLTFYYPGHLEPTISNLNIKVSKGQFLAIVGPSGAGKTTLIDLILGVLDPDSGNVTISGESPSSVFQNWPGSVAYVPQDVAMIEGSIRENVTLGYPPHEIPDEAIISVLKTARLWEIVENLKEGLDHNVGERGMKLSGGQRQRLGISRALLTNPKFIVLDEATSALDGETERQISESLKILKGDCTLVVVAHRLSTVRDADLVAYLDKGNLIALGDFETVRNLVPDFDNQAKLMGF